MARVKIECTCKVCGGKFEHIKFKNNREQADSYEEWAKENITICPDCFRRNKTETEINKAESKYPLPELTGTEKQIAFARKLRAEHINKDSNVEGCIRILNKDEAFMAQIAKYANGKGISEEEAINELISVYSLEKTILCLQETNAGKLLDVIA